MAHNPRTNGSLQSQSKHFHNDSRSSRHSREASTSIQQQQRSLQDDERSSCTTNPEMCEGLMNPEVHRRQRRSSSRSQIQHQEYAVHEEPSPGKARRTLTKSSDFYPDVHFNSLTGNPEVQNQRRSSSRSQTEHQEYAVQEEPSPGKARRTLTKSSDFHPDVHFNSLTGNPEVQNQRHSSSKLQTEHQNLAVEKESRSGKSRRSLTKSSDLYPDSSNCSTKNSEIHSNQRSPSSKLKTEHPGDQRFSSSRSGSAPREESQHLLSQSPEDNQDGQVRSSSRSYQESHLGQQCSSSQCRREHPADQATTPDGKRSSITKSQDVQDDLSVVSSMYESPIQRRDSSQLQTESRHEQIRSSTHSREEFPNGQQHSLSHSYSKPVRSSAISVNSFADEEQATLSQSGSEHPDVREVHSGDKHRSHTQYYQLHSGSLNSEIHNEERFENNSDKVRSSVEEVSPKEQQRSSSQSRNSRPSDREAHAYEKRRSHSKSGDTYSRMSVNSDNTHSSSRVIGFIEKRSHGSICHSTHSGDEFSEKQSSLSQPQNRSMGGQVRHSVQSCNDYPSEDEPRSQDKKSSLAKSGDFHDSAKNSLVPSLDLTIGEQQTPSELPLDVRSRSTTGSHEMYPNLLRHQSHDDNSFKINGYPYEGKQPSTRSDAFNNEKQHSLSQSRMHSADNQIKVFPDQKSSSPADVTESCTEEESDTVILQADGSWQRVTESRVSSRASVQREQACNDEINEEFKASVAQLNHVLEKMEARVSAGQQDLGEGSDALMAEVTKLQGRLSGIGMRQSVLHITNQNELPVERNSGRQRYFNDSESESEVSRVLQQDGTWKPVRPTRSKPPGAKLRAALVSTESGVHDGKQNYGCRPSQIEQRDCGSGTEMSTHDESQGDGETECLQRSGKWAHIKAGSGTEMPAHVESKEDGGRERFQIHVDDKDQLSVLVWTFEEDGAHIKRLAREADERMSSNLQAGDLLIEINGTATVDKSKREIQSLWEKAQEDPFQGVNLTFARS